MTHTNRLIISYWLNEFFNEIYKKMCLDVMQTVFSSFYCVQNNTITTAEIMQMINDYYTCMSLTHESFENYTAEFNSIENNLYVLCNTILSPHDSCVFYFC
jgi:hypothetical protein